MEISMSIYDTLNEQQREAVFHTEGPVLILAGAGSGKTRVLTHRTAYLIEEKGVNPYNIMAITFTNKAAGEMRERIDQLVGYGSESIWVSTFHSTCVRILRRHIDRIGFDTNFTIYDSDDQKTLMKDICKRLNVDTKIYKERSLLAAISKAKDELVDPQEFSLRAAASGDFAKRKQAEIYREYQDALRRNNALDFDDLIVKTVELFKTDDQVLDYYQERFRYIMVDEYQDTNTAQFELISILARKYKNLCVVGDDDQSIYKFRGANIYNILNFEKHFPEAVTIKLEQNYRSTQNILNAANGVIANNKGRKEKKLWTENQKGELVHFKQYDTEYDEADGVVSRINFLAMRGVQYKDMAILYRTNAQSRIFEEKLKQKNIPYAIVRGISFYDRKEIKDLMSYLKVVDSGMDDLSVKRIINVPKRGIGQTTINRLQEFAILNQMSFLDAVFNADEIPEVTRALAKLHKFADMIEEFREYASEHEISELLEHILDVTQYRAELEAEGTDESISRLEDIEELFNDIAYYEEEEENPNLRDFLAEKDMYTLNAGIDNLEDENNKVLLMTLHNAKGLEFNNVFLGGMEEGVFPGFGAMMSGDESEIEEERRLCYVGITRAKERLFLSAAKRRMLRGQTQYNRRSRFIDEIPGQYLDTEQRVSEQRVVKNTERPAKYQYGAKAGKPYNLSDFKVKPVGELDYQVGDRVKHIKFGVGTVQEITKGGRDFEVAVEFDRVGRKKMFASFAKLKKVK